MATRSFTHHFPTFRKLCPWAGAQDSLGVRQFKFSAFGVAAILIFAVAFLTLSIREYSEEDARVNESAVLQAAGAAALDLAAVETAQRSFLLTRQPAALQQFDRTRHDFQSHLVELVQLLKVDTKRRDAVRQIDRQFQAWMNDVAQLGHALAVEQEVQQTGQRRSDADKGEHNGQTEPGSVADR